MIVVEINQADSAVESRTFNNERGQRTVYSQTAYLHKPGQAYPDRFRIPVNSPAEAYPPGRYTLGPTCFRIGKYGDLEVNRYEIQLLPQDAQAPAQSSQDAKASDKPSGESPRTPRAVNG